MDFLANLMYFILKTLFGGYFYLPHSGSEPETQSLSILFKITYLISVVKI